jgi:hypothetical protein
MCTSCMDAKCVDGLSCSPLDIPEEGGTSCGIVHFLRHVAPDTKGQLGQSLTRRAVPAHILQGHTYQWNAIIATCGLRSN